ncbi:M20/M25/M40 family metallo-hydrolase [Haloparvum sp. PAK95]|uniref:M20/M25/M40 family metallo-hydrolase n=1 Tax=Haloparvum sp. PAK95 TaxID=3418962 RepID=UPI003D2EBA85
MSEEPPATTPEDRDSDDRNPEDRDPGDPPLSGDAFDPIAFLESIVRIPSHDGVTDARDFLVATLGDFGIDATVDDAGNVIATKSSPDPDAGPHVVLNTHVDTVSPHVAFERDADATVAGESGVDVIRGRGSCDAKAQIATLVAAFLRTEPEWGKLSLAITPDEETLSLGAAALTGQLPDTAPSLDGDCYVVGEPTGLDVCSAAKGRFEGTVHLSGVTAHAAEEAGVNAIAAAEDALAAIRTFDADATPHDQLGAPKLTPTVVEGGGATNQVPADCAITVDRRSVPPETADEFGEDLEAAVSNAVADDVGVAFAFTERESPFLEAFATEPTHELVEVVADAAEAARETTAPDAAADRGGDVRPFSAATEASYFAPAPTVVFGPGDLADDEGAVAHSEREYVRVREVEWAADAATRALRELLS